MSTSSPTDRPRLVFVFPYHGVGGVSLLFLRVAEFLAENELAQTWLVDYPDGFMAKHRRPGLADLVPYADDSEVVLPQDVVAVFQSMTPWSIFPSLRIPATTRVVFWNCHPFNLVPTLPGLRHPMQSSVRFGRLLLKTVLRGYREKMRRLVSLMVEGRSLVFMDLPNVQTTERYLDVRIAAPVYLPIPYTPPAAGMVDARDRPLPAAKLRIGWVGRLVDFKFHVLHRALLELDAAQPALGLAVHVTVIGGGDFERKLREVANALGRVEVLFVPYCAPSELDSYMLENFDVAFAMGTSALDAAKLGIPTLLMDLSYKPVPADYRFEWLHRREGFSLAEVIGPEHLGGSGSMRLRLKEFLSDPRALRHAAREYAQRNHELPSICSRLLTVAAGTACTWRKLVDARLTGRGLLYGTFASVRNWLPRS